MSTFTVRLKTFINSLRLRHRRHRWRVLDAFRNRRARLCFVCLCILTGGPCMVLLNVLLWCGSSVETAGVYNKNGEFVHYFPHRHFVEKEVKTALLWDSKMEFMSLSDDDFKNCPVSACRWSRDRSDVTTSDAILFSSRGLWNYFLPGYVMPTHRTPDQVWIFFEMEPPPHTFLDLSRYEGVFNWTIHYRDDADLVGRYGRLVPIETPNVPTSAKQGPQSPPEVRNYAREKNAMVAWMSSNCVDDARRQRIVTQLSRYMPVDGFGTCGSRECDYKGCDEQLSKYKFFLALENARCRDYHTEKLFNVYDRNSIPVTNADLHSSNAAPPGSYIQISDFDSVQQLADHLNMLAHNETAYNAYMGWRQKWKVEHFKVQWCEMCERLHNRSRPAQVYTRISDWLANDTCLPWSFCRYVRRIVDGWSLFYGLID